MVKDRALPVFGWEKCIRNMKNLVRTEKKKNLEICMHATKNGF